VTPFALFLRAAAAPAPLRVALALAGLCPLLGLAALVGSGRADARAEDLVRMVGLGAVLPFVALVATERTAARVRAGGGVLWLRGDPPWRTAGAAWSATVAVVGATAVLGVVAGAIAAGAGVVLVAKAAAAAAIAGGAYTALALALGLRLQHALLWGLGYVLVWEAAVAREGGVAAALSVRHHAEAVLDGSPGSAVTLIMATIAALAVTAAVLRRPPGPH
jgi:ABC-2 type transport system permease protein